MMSTATRKGTSLACVGETALLPAGHSDQVAADEASRYFEAAAAILATAPVKLDVAALADVLARHYGLAADVALLSSEVETTAEVVLSDGRRLILKASPQPEAIDSFRFQSAALAAVAAAPGFVSPQIVLTVGGKLVFQQEGLTGYLQTRLAGSPLHQVVMSPALLHAAGAALARLDLALRGLALPAVERPVLWHIGCWPRLPAFQRFMPLGQTADRVRAALEAYLTMVEPRLGDVDWQVTHNDASPFNMLLGEDGVGFIDFGDGCRGPRIQDLAIAASHMVNDPALPLGGAESMIAGYASVCPLSPLEVELLVGLMKARQSALILINAWRSHLFPEQAAYINKNVGRAETGLSILSRLDREAARRFVAEAVATA